MLFQFVMNGRDVVGDLDFGGLPSAAQRGLDTPLIQGE